MRRLLWMGVLALAACGTSQDETQYAGPDEDDVLPESDTALAGPTLDLVRALSSAEPAVRLNAAHALAKSHDAAAAPALLRELADKDSFARKAAAEALGCVLEETPRDTAARRAAQKGLGKLLRDDDLTVRYQAVDAFSRLREQRSVPLLIKVMRNDKDDSVRGEAAFALGEIADPSAFDALKDALKDDGNSWKVSYALAALAKNGDKSAAQFLLDALTHKRYAMITGAGEFFATQSGPEIDSHLIEMMQQSHEMTLALLLVRHPNPKVAAAAKALGASVDGEMSYGRTGC